MPSDDARSTPLGVALLSALTGLYGLLYLATGAASADPTGRLLALGVGIVLLALAVGLAAGSRLAWAAGLVAFGLGALKRLAELAAGDAASAVGLLLALAAAGYLLSRYGWYWNAETAVAAG